MKRTTIEDESRTLDFARTRNLAAMSASSMVGISSSLERWSILTVEKTLISNVMVACYDS